MNLRSPGIGLRNLSLGSTQRGISDCPSSARGERVAIVDDEEAMTTVTSILLKRLGYETVSFHSAAQFKEAFDAAPERIDLVVADVVMPGISGVQLVRALRDSGHQIPILLMTGYTVQKHLQPGGSEGRISFVRKPFTTTHLAQSVRRLLSDR
jgi:two-component system, cell cycle sensor histidine kinase and response regulator CckA